MAERVANKPPAEEAGSDDLQVLNPDQGLIIKGRKLTVREYGFVEGLGLRPLIQPFLDDLYAVTIIQKGVPPLEAIIGVLGKHADLVAELISISANVEVEWVRVLPPRQGNALMYAWWTANGPFFVDAVMDRIRGELAVEADRKARAGQTSTRPSSPEDTEPLPPSVS